MIKESIEEILSEQFIISYIKLNNKSKWYLSPIDYWVMNHWGQYGISHKLDEKEQSEEFLKLISNYEITKERLSELFITNNEKNLIPEIYMDYDNYEFINNCGEWILEDSAALPIWKTKRNEIIKLIPDEDVYWN